MAGRALVLPAVPLSTPVVCFPAPENPNMAGDPINERSIAAAGLALVLALHALVLWWLWSQHLIPAPDAAMTLFVDFIAPPPPKAEESPPAKPRPPEKPQARQLVAEAPVQSPIDYVAPLPPPAPVKEVAPTPPPKAVGPVNLGSELSVACTERTPPAYPSVARRFGEEGTVTLRVELDEQGTVAAARVAAAYALVRFQTFSIPSA